MDLQDNVEDLTTLDKLDPDLFVGYQRGVTEFENTRLALRECHPCFAYVSDVRDNFGHCTGQTVEPDVLRRHLTAYQNGLDRDSFESETFAKCVPRLKRMITLAESNCELFTEGTLLKYLNAIANWVDRTCEKRRRRFRYVVYDLALLAKPEWEEKDESSDEEV